MGRTVWMLALFGVLPAQNLAADQGKNSKEAASPLAQAQQAVDSDRARLDGAIKKTENAAQDLRIVARNQSQAVALSRNLAEEAQTQTHHAAQTQREQATKDYSIALLALKNSKSTNLNENEKDARRKSEKLDKLAEAEDKTAIEVLHRQRKARDDEVVRSYHEAHQASKNMLKDKNTLKRAMKREGKREEDYEREERTNEHYAEHMQDHAEHQKDSAYDAIEHIFERAEDYLYDMQIRGRSDQKHASHQRLRSIQHAVETVQETMTKTAKDNKASKAKASDAALPIDLLEAKPAAKADDSKADKRAEELAARKEEMRKAQDTVDSDQARLEAAITKSKSAVKDLRIAAQNRTHAEALSINLAQEVSNQATRDSKQKQETALKDYYTSLYELKKSSATGNWEAAEKDARQKSDNVDRLNEEEEHNAREKLHSRRKARNQEVRQTYHESSEASRNLLRDKDRLESAERHAGQAERQYEGDEMSNEHLAEHSQDVAERQHDDATDAVELIFEGAEDHLHHMQHQGRREREAATHQRHRAIRDAVQTLRQEAKEAKETSGSTAINLLAVKGQKTEDKQELADDAQKKVDSDRSDLDAAVKKTENAAKDLRIAARNRTVAEAVSLHLAREVQTQAAQDTSHEKKQATDDFSTALYELKNSAKTGHMDNAARAARQKSNAMDEVDEKEDRAALKELKSRRHARREEVRRSCHEANDAATNLLEDRNHLENAQRRAGMSEKEYEGEEMRNERFAEHSRDYAGRTKDDSNDAIDLIFDRAEHHLGEIRRQRHRDHRVARHQRDQAIQEAVETVREEAKAKAKDVSSVALPINLAATPANNNKRESAAELEHTVADDRTNLEAAIKDVEGVQSDIRRAAQNRTHADNMGRQLAEEAQREVHSAAKAQQAKATSDYNIALVALQKAPATGNWEDAEKSARQKSDDVHKAENEEEKMAKDKLNSRRKARSEEVRKSYRGALDAARTMLKDRNRLENAEEREGESERAREKEEMQNEFYAERLRDHAERQKDDADDAIDLVFRRAEDHLEHNQGKNRAARRTADHERHQAIQEAVETLQTEAQAAKKAKAEQAAKATKKANGAKEETEATTELVEKHASETEVKANKNAKKGKEWHILLAIRYDASTPLLLLAAASVGLLVLFVKRSRRRPIPNLAPPLLG